VVNTAQGKGGNGGRIDALQDLARNGVSLSGVRLEDAWLEGIQLEGASLPRASLRNAQILGARHAPPGWREWMLARGAMEGESVDELSTSQTFSQDWRAV
jgi:pentapeptide repeat protein